MAGRNTKLTTNLVIKKPFTGLKQPV